MNSFQDISRWILIGSLILLAGALIYLILNLLPLFRTLKSLNPGLSSMSGKLETTRSKTAQIKEYNSRSLPRLGKALGGYAFYRILIRVFRKGSDGKHHVLSNIEKEVVRYNSPAAAKILMDLDDAASAIIQK